MNLRKLSRSNPFKGVSDDAPHKPPDLMTARKHSDSNPFIGGSRSRVLPPFRKLLLPFWLCLLVPALVTYRRLHGIASAQFANNNSLNTLSLLPSNVNPSFQLQLEKVCPASLEINSQNTILPPSELLSLKEAKQIVKYFYDFNCEPHNMINSCRFDSIGQHLLHYASLYNTTLLTVQVGAMDGKSNDPLYEMFVSTGKANINHINVKRASDSSLELNNWLPVIVEPVYDNYKSLLGTYKTIANENHLGCAVPLNAAVSYDSPDGTCPFCRFNTAEDAPEICKNSPDWIKFQLGSLDCEWRKRHHGEEKFNLCIVQDPLPCSSIEDMLSEKGIPLSIHMLQIDIEGYEYMLLDKFINNVPSHLLPPVIHYEHKVMSEHDKLEHSGISSRLKSLEDLLTGRGYKLYNQGEDILGLLLN